MKKGLSALLCIMLLIPSNMQSSDLLIDALELTNLLSGKVGKKVKELWRFNPKKSGMIYIPTLAQGTISDWPNGSAWDEIQIEDGANCGYHALKNVLFLMNAFKQNSDTFLEDLNKAQPFFDCMQLWASMVYVMRGETLPINNLRGDELDLLIKHLGYLKMMPGLSRLDTDFDIVVIEDIGDDVVNEEMYAPTKRLAQQNSGMFGAVWNPGGGHWIGFVVRKQRGVQKIFYMDSCNCSNRNCARAINVFSKSIQEIDQIVFQNQKLSMLDMLVRMRENADILGGNNYPAGFNAVDKIDTIFTHVLVGWKDNDQAAFDHEVQQQLYDVLSKILKFLNSHPQEFAQINWNEFGVGQMRKFNGFKEVMDTVIARIKSLPSFNEEEFRKIYIEPLLA